MSKLRLFIENQELELNDDVQFNITKQFEDLSNPTVMINDWSKTVSIPFSQTNNRIFGFFNVIDSFPAQSSSVTPIGLNFDPNKRLNFRLQDGDSVLMMGYAKMNSVTQQDGKGTYNLTLNGQLGNLFKEMQKINFDYDESEDEDVKKYQINTREYFNQPITKELIYECWSNEGNNLNSIDEAYNGEHYNINPNDIIGFAPNNAKIEGFDYNTVDTFDENEGIRKVRTFAEIIDADPDRTATLNMTGESILPNGLTPREFGDYRAYLQLPYCYWHILWGIFQNKAEELTGYKFDLDKRWFNRNNPYWRNLAYMLKAFNPKDLTTVTTDYALSYTYQDFIMTYGSNPQIKTPVAFGENRDSVLSFNPEETVRLNLEIPIQFKLRDLYIAPGNFKDFKMRNHFYITVWYKNRQGAKMFSKKIVVIGTDAISQSVLDDPDVTGYVSWEEFTKNKQAVMSPAGNTIKDIVIPNIFTQYIFIKSKDLADFDNAIGIELELKPISTSGAALSWRFECKDGSTQLNLRTYLTIGYSADRSSVLTTSVRSRRDNTTTVSLKDFWNSEVKPFDEILRYCKMFNIYVEVDDVAKKIKFIQKNHYFADYSIEDWTDKVDYSKDYTLESTRGDKRYLLFNYEDSKVANNEFYKTKYGYNYGEIRVDTQNNFNDETEKLFKNNKINITNSPNVLSWNILFWEHTLRYLIPSESFVNCSDKEGKIVDPFGSFYFYNGISKFDLSDGMRGVVISDDTLQQSETDTYYYYEISQPNQDEYAIEIYSYPKLSIAFDNKLINFNIPSETFDVKAYEGNSISVYSAFWRNYLNEKYSVFNKKLTCYINLKNIDYQNFKFNHFVKINNVLYLVNKIFDYNPSNPTTKVELLSVTSLKGYTDNDFNYLALDAYERQTVYKPETDTTGSFKVFSNKPVVINDMSGFESVTITGNTVSYNAGRILSLTWDGYITLGVEGDDNLTATYHIHQSAI